MLITLPNPGDDSISKITLSLMLTSSDHTPSDQGLLGFTMGFIMVLKNVQRAQPVST
jgi:hypothetical protein